jgi:hypothetical protein
MQKVKKYDIAVIMLLLFFSNIGKYFKISKGGSRAHAYIDTKTQTHTHKGSVMITSIHFLSLRQKCGLTAVWIRNGPIAVKDDFIIVQISERFK